MRSKSDFSQKNKIKFQGQLSGILLFGLCSFSYPAVAQDGHFNDDGAQLPSPPAIKQRGGGDGEDPPFEPPAIDKEGAPSFNRHPGSSAGGGMDEGFRRRQRFQRQFNGERPPQDMEGGSPEQMPMQERRGPREFGGEGMPRRNMGPNGRGMGPRGGPYGIGIAPGPGKQLDLTPLGLSEEQKTKIQQMREQSKSKVKELHKTLVTKQTEVRTLVFGAESTETQIRAARKELLKIQEQIDDTNFNDLLSIRKLLTAEQKKKLPECTPLNSLSRGNGPPDQMPGAGFRKLRKEEFSQKNSGNEPLAGPGAK